jgi:hypothetical protein
MNVIGLLARKLGIFLSAVMAAYLLAATAATQHVIARLAEMGVYLDWGERVAMTLRDFAGMSGMFLPLIAFGLLVAFLVTALLCIWLHRWRTPLYVLAGFTALVTLHVAMNLAVGLTPVAIARTSGGLLLQGLAGAVGGFVYAWLNGRIFPRSPFEAPQ